MADDIGLPGTEIPLFTRESIMDFSYLNKVEQPESKESYSSVSANTGVPGTEVSECNVLGISGGESLSR